MYEFIINNPFKYKILIIQTKFFAQKPRKCPIS